MLPLQGLEFRVSFVLGVYVLSPLRTAREPAGEQQRLTHEIKTNEERTKDNKDSERPVGSHPQASRAGFLLVLNQKD